MRRARREPALFNDTAVAVSNAPERETDRSPAGEVERLQRAAGNRAVGSLLARDAEKEDKDGTKDATSTTLVMPDPIGVLPVISFNFGSNRNEINVLVPSSGADPKLFETAAKGAILGDVTISTGSGFKIIIGQAVLSSVHSSGNGLMISINGVVTPKSPDTQSAPGTPAVPAPPNHP